jgi:hypothetical protein
VLASKVTGIATLGLEAPAAEISISPAHVSVVVIPDVFTCAVTLPGVAPLAGEITSQLPQEVVLDVAVKLRVAPVLLVIAIF